MTRHLSTKLMKPVAYSTTVFVLIVCLLQIIEAHADEPKVAADNITYITWGGYERPELHAEYVAKYGASPTIAFMADEEAALQKIRAGYKPDIAHPCAPSVRRWFDAGVLKPIDVTKIARWEYVSDTLKNYPGTLIDGQVYWVPFDWGSHSVAYRTDLVDPVYDRQESWQLLLDPRYKGRIGMWDSVDAAIAFGGAILGIKDTGNVSDEQFDRIEQVLDRQRILVTHYWQSESQAESSLASGEFVATYLWAASVRRLKSAGIPVKFMSFPSEGKISFACGLVLLADGEGDESAKYDFINAMLAESTGIYLFRQYGYGHSNTNSFNDITDAELAEIGYSRDIDAFLNSTTMYQYWPMALRERYIRMWEFLKRK